MADRPALNPEALTARLRGRWPLPQHPAPAEELLRRWSEPHRRYHDLRHLDECLAAAAELGGDERVHLALWFHDAVHHNTPGADEQASADLAASLLGPVLPREEVAEVIRLILVTLNHVPNASDAAGAIVSDADLWVLGASPERYAASVRELRAELGQPADRWREGRRSRLQHWLRQPPYVTPYARVRWARRARANLADELAAIEADSVRSRIRS